MPQYPPHHSLKSLAVSLDISAGTVSRNLSGQSERCRISPATRDRVLAHARNSGLIVNQLARSLRLRRTFTLGLVIPDISNPFFALLARQIERHARTHGYSVLLADSQEDSAVEVDAITLMLSRHVDGLILAPVGTRGSGPRIQSLIRGPCVLVDRLLPGVKLPSVTSDHRQGAELAVNHLIDRGHRHIACVQGSPGTFANDQRLAGWRSAMKHAQLPCSAQGIFGGAYSIDAGYQAAQTLLRRSKRPTAILALGNLLALGVLQALRQEGLAIPRDLSLVSFDDQPWAGVVDPPLTIIQQPIEELGSQVFALLLKQITTRRNTPAQCVTLPVRIIERASVHDIAS